MNEMVKTNAPSVVENDAGALIGEDVRVTLANMAQIMKGMADMMRTTNERMGALEEQVRALTKVTPAQANSISAAIRDRANEACQEYHALGCEKAAANAIRKELRLTLGIQSVREIPRCDYEVAMETVGLWDDYKAMKAIRAKGVQMHG